MGGWRHLQTSILAITCLGTFAVLAKLILVPTTAQPFRPAVFEFPATVPLSGWQPSASGPVDHSPNYQMARQRLLSSKQYEYQRQGTPLQIELYYTIDTSGNVMGFLRNYTSIPLSAIQPSVRDERYREGVGYYLVFVHQQRAYLTSCINPRGGSTVTLPQFRHNRYTQDIRIDRFFRWLLNAESIRDERCLWVNLSTPLANGSQETVYSVLESAWVSWYNWWQPRFPKS